VELLEGPLLVAFPGAIPTALAAGEEAPFPLLKLGGAAGEVDLLLEEDGETAITFYYLSVVIS
jgi:hypothetical protein